jgi:hypothetical protein
MKQRAAEVRAVEVSIEELEAEEIAADRHVLTLPEVAGEDLEALARYREAAGLRELRLLEAKRECEQRLEQQRVRMLEAGTPESASHS